MDRRMQKRQLQQGQGAIEFVIIALILLILIGAIVQFGLLYRAKSTLNLAAFEAVRAGTLNNAQMEPMLKGLARGMMPLFMGGQKKNYSLDDDAGGVNKAFIKTLQHIDLNRAKILILNPTKPMFKDFSVYDPVSRKYQIPNDNLLYRNQKEKGMSIQDANLLQIEVIWCHPLYVPLINRIIVKVLDWGKDPNNNFCKVEVEDKMDTSTTYYFPLMSGSLMRMQSPVYDSEFLYDPAATPSTP